VPDRLLDLHLNLLLGGVSLGRSLFGIARAHTIGWLMSDLRGGTFLSARWHDLAMLNFEVDPGLVRPLVPEGTELDRFGGRCYVSLVGFRFLEVRLRGLPIPFHTRFDEVNLRFYVSRREGAEVRRGVAFVRELVPLPAVALTARLVYGERYSSLPMRHRIAPDAVRYEWRVGGRWRGFGLTPHGEAALPAQGSEEEFITEHYWGYAATRRGTVEYRVEHARWPVRSARPAGIDHDAERLYGPGFAAALKGTPTSAFLAAGSPVRVLAGRLLEKRW
jgi:uncharacterized protein YqjF (DUF2071 family)